jgi:hypothetical protein
VTPWSDDLRDTFCDTEFGVSMSQKPFISGFPEYFLTGVSVGPITNIIRHALFAEIEALRFKARGYQVLRKAGPHIPRPMTPTFFMFWLAFLAFPLHLQDEFTGIFSMRQERAADRTNPGTRLHGP